MSCTKLIYISSKITFWSGLISLKMIFRNGLVLDNLFKITQNYIFWGVKGKKGFRVNQVIWFFTLNNMIFT
ncbi:MAG: hypothetical protein DRQ49_13390 [Gammaproteobacteria bacterium]|nr:MAG: hypothetical protein DRQ41_14900 [Gammaproteobacteria bacterium]RKZ38791.1 MAG: hypothetical protein DRQ49_13390 [Gammaproteobacteria bacterium]RKZ76048.1 MAG: hypothetical protein DRQ57_05365 [Gammaproteobacteria bacterium]